MILGTYKLEPLEMRAKSASTICPFTQQFLRPNVESVTVSGTIQNHLPFFNALLLLPAGNLSFTVLILQLFRLAFYLNPSCSSKCAICLLFESGFSKQRRHLAWPLAFPFSLLKLKNCVMPRVRVLQKFTKLMIVL